MLLTVEVDVQSKCGLDVQRCAKCRAYMARVTSSAVNVTMAGPVPTVINWLVTVGVLLMATVTTARVSASRVGMANSAP